MVDEVTVFSLFVSNTHSWAPLTENLAGDKRLSLIANSNLGQLNG